ncbi:mitochondrial outer membrane import complex protein METAXIN-like [Populus alba]|uniref:mitochondrial outer membrane import complex protein METAXIN-like n=1 Tax=Populus alba TaxID=43335 RepID=UPI003CC76A24
MTSIAMESSMLQSALLEHGNLIRYAEKLKTDFMEAGSSSSVPQFLSDASSTSTRRPSNSGSKPKKQPKRERTEEEKTFRRRARYFLVTQVVAVLVFLSVMSSNDFSEVEVDEDEDEDEGFSYD